FLMPGTGWVNALYNYNPVGNFYELVYALHEYTGSFRFRITNSCGTAYSDPVHVQVGVSINQQPQPQTVSGCATVQFSIVAAGVGPLLYQWRKGGVPLIDDGRITGATTATLTINGKRYSDEGSYDCIVTDSCESRTSNAAQLASPIPTWVHRTSSG